MTIVLALGGNALGDTLPEQMAAVRSAAVTLVDLLEAGHRIAVTHGNGPQVGMLNLAMTELSRNHPQHTPAPISVCTAMSQGYIGYDLQNALGEELERRGCPTGVATVLTQVEVDANDPAFLKPTKPIGAFMTAEEAAEMQRRGNPVMEDARRGYRRVVASPRPQRIVELETIRALLAAGQVPICCGGGGIPVARRDGHLKGMGAVIDKDFCAALLADALHADTLIILTAVKQVALNYGTRKQKNLSRITPAEARQYLSEGHFAAGSMAPKVQAALEFTEKVPARRAIIAHLEDAALAVAGTAGTIIAND